MAPISFLQPTQTVCADNNVCNACCKRYKIKLNYCQGQKDVCSFKLGRSFEYSIYLPTNLFNADTKKKPISFLPNLYKAADFLPPLKICDQN